MSDLVCTNPTEQSVLNRSTRDKFILVLTLPHILKKESVRDEILSKLDKIEISVFGTIVPDVSIPTVPVPYGGQVVNVSSHTRPNYGPLTVSFAIDNSYTNYYVLWRWLAILNDPRYSSYAGTEDRFDEPIETGNLNEYQANFSIFALNEYNQVVTEFKYYNAFITSLKGINYSYKEAEMLETTAEFQFSQFDVLRTTRMP